MDYLTLETSKGGYDNILVITDHFTRYAQAIPTRNQTAHTTAKALFESFIVHYGFPARLHSDQGRNFELKVIRGLCKIAGTRKSRTTPYHPMGNGMCQRFNQTLLSMLGTLSADAKADWKSHIAPLVHAYNATRHDSVKCSPFSLMFGREPRLPVDVAMGLPQSKECPSKDYAAALQEKLRHAYEVAEACADEAAECQQRNYNTEVRAAILAAGDRVLVKSVGVQGKNKLGDVWEEEPHLVHSQPNKDLPVYVVKREDGTGRTRTLHCNMLLPISHLNFHDEERRHLPERRRLRRRTPRRPPTTDSDSSSIYSTEDEIRIPMMVPVGRDATPNLLTPEESPPEIVMEDRTAGKRNTGDDSEEQLSAPGSGGSLVDSLPVEARVWVEDENTQQTTTHTGNTSDSESPAGPEPPGDAEPQGGSRRSRRERRHPDWYGTGTASFSQTQLVQRPILSWHYTGAAPIWVLW